jgi:hypothetical protein
MEMVVVAMEARRRGRERRTRATAVNGSGNAGGGDGSSRGEGGGNEGDRSNKGGDCSGEDSGVVAAMVGMAVAILFDGSVESAVTMTAAAVVAQRGIENRMAARGFAPFCLGGSPRLLRSNTTSWLGLAWLGLPTVWSHLTRDAVADLWMPCTGGERSQVSHLITPWGVWLQLGRESGRVQAA